MLKIVVLQQRDSNLSDEEMQYCLLIGCAGRRLRDWPAIGSYPMGAQSGFKELLAREGGAEAQIIIAIALVFVARRAYRLMQKAALTSAGARLATQDFGHSPVTPIIIGVVASYYARYAIRLIRWRATAMEPTAIAAF
jgi:hypothetical protein